MHRESFVTNGVGHLRPAIAQLVEHLTVVCSSNQMVPGSIPGGRSFLFKWAQITFTDMLHATCHLEHVSMLCLFIGYCGAPWNASKLQEESFWGHIGGAVQTRFRRCDFFVYPLLVWR